VNKMNLPYTPLTLYLILLLGVTITNAAVPIPELTLRPAIPQVAPTTEQQLSQLQQQLQSLQAQLAALQAVVQIAPASAAGQEPTVTIVAGNLGLRASRELTLNSGSNTLIRANAALNLRSDGSTAVRAAGSLNLDGASVRLNGGTKGLATVGSIVQSSAPFGTTGNMVPVSGQIMNGSQNVYAN
jgi:hypothetical protein